MREPSLKWVLISVIIGLTAILLSYNAYSGLVTMNNATISNEYIERYERFEDTQGNYSDWGSERDTTGPFEIAWDLIRGFATAIVMGVTSLRALVVQLTGITTILQQLILDFSMFSLLIGMVISVITIWITYRALSEARGTTQS